MKKNDYNKIISKLFKFESNDQISEFMFRSISIHIWPLVRYQIYNKILSEELNLQTSHFNKPEENLFFSTIACLPSGYFTL